jgi:hypothetical protein
MLKLTRNSHEGKINIIVREKEFFATRSLVIAFAIALGIHLGLWLLFHIAPFTILISNHVFPPTSVEADTPTNESVIAEMSLPMQTIRGLPNPPHASPIILPQPNFLSVRPVEYTKETNVTYDAFSQIEHDIYYPSFQPLLYLSKKRLKIVVSGILGQYTALINEFENKDKSIPKFDIDQRISYMVIVEGRSGKIFWFEPIESAPSKEMNKLAENILLKMRFDTNPSLLAVSGEIELHFNQEAE